MIDAITYIGKRNDKLGLYPFKRWTTLEALPAHIKTLMSESPAFAAQFLDAQRFKAFMRSRRLLPPPKPKSMIPPKRVPEASPIRKS